MRGNDDFGLRCSFPDLEGTEKQVDWALRIRRDHISNNIQKWIATGDTETYLRWECQRSASMWIEEAINANRKGR